MVATGAAGCAGELGHAGVPCQFAGAQLAGAMGGKLSEAMGAAVSDTGAAVFTTAIGDGVGVLSTRIC